MGKRGKRAAFDSATIARARSALGELSHNNGTLAAVSVLLAEALKLSRKQIGSVLNVSVATVGRMNRRFRDPAAAATHQWGGLRHSALPGEAESEVMASLVALAEEGRIVCARQVQVAVEEKRGTGISIQTAYNIMHRHGWRKVAPDKAHPKGDKDRQEDFKKKRSRRCWRWLPPMRMQPESR